MIFLGIDAGGTKTIAVAADSKSEQIRTSAGGPGALSATGINGVKILFTGLLKELNLIGSIDKVKAATFGFSGVGRETDKMKVEEEIRKIGFKNFKLITDGELLYYSAFREGDGILLEAGTGAVCIIGKNSELTQIGGWGFILGDAGGGYRMGKLAIQKTLAEHDKNLPASDFSSEILKYYNVRRREELISIVYSADNAQKLIASSASKICELAGDNDPEALSIVEDAAAHLFALLQTAIDRYEDKSKLKIAFSGSILSKGSPVLKKFNKKLETSGIDFTEVNINIEPAAAGVIHAINHAGERVSKTLTKRLEGLSF